MNTPFGPLVFHNIEYLVLDHHMQEVLLATSILELIGFDPNKHLSMTWNQLYDLEVSHFSYTAQQDATAQTSNAPSQETTNSAVSLPPKISFVPSPLEALLLDLSGTPPWMKFAPLNFPASFSSSQPPFTDSWPPSALTHLGRSIAGSSTTVD